MSSSLKPLGQLKPNCPGMIIGRSSTKFLFSYADQQFKMATTAGHRLTLDPMGKMFQNAPSLKPLGQLKPNCPGMIIGRSSTNTKSCRSCHFEFHIGTKNVKFAEDHPMNIHVQFGFNHICSF
jgi:hypothetical protein